MLDYRYCALYLAKPIYPHHQLEQHGGCYSHSQIYLTQHEQDIRNALSACPGISLLLLTILLSRHLLNLP